MGQPALRLILSTWFHRLEVCFSYKEVLSVEKGFPTCEPSHPPSGNVNDTVIRLSTSSSIFFFMFSQKRWRLSL